MVSFSYIARVADLTQANKLNYVTKEYVDHAVPMAAADPVHGALPPNVDMSVRLGALERPRQSHTTPAHLIDIFGCGLLLARTCCGPHPKDVLRVRRLC